MGKKRPKSRPVRLAGAPSTLPASIAGDSTPVSASAVLMKACRLCETKDGPFLNIFDADKVIAKRINEVLPFDIAENDELPSKICFRCSAKLEELYEFILKCLKTQDSLQTSMGKKIPLVTKSRYRVRWEQQLKKKKISNDDICNALIKKALDGVKDLPINPLPLTEEKPQLQPHSDVKFRNCIEPMISKIDKVTSLGSSKNNVSYESDDHSEVNLKQVKLTIEKCDKEPVNRNSRSSKSEAEPMPTNEQPKPSKKLRQYPSRKSQSGVETSPSVSIPIGSNTSDKSKPDTIQGAANLRNNHKEESDKEKSKAVPPPVKEPEAPAPPPINIMDHVSTIKVNSVGTLFLCKLCNRNFLKKEIVLTHGCARNIVPKDKYLHNAPPRNIPRPPVTVKYIKMNTDFKKPVADDPKPVVTENKPVEVKGTPDFKVNIPVNPKVKPKPKAGPASRVKNVARAAEVPQALPAMTPPSQPLPSPQPSQEERAIPAVQFPTVPSLNSRYKLVPGPNNTFTLVEDSTAQNVNINQAPAPTPPIVNNPAPRPRSKKRKVGDDASVNPGMQSTSIPSKESNVEVIDLADDVPPQPAVIEQPYPVGLFTTPHHSGGFASNIPKPPTFTTPAMKKQSYTIVQTGNPSKLLISTKPQPVVEEPQRKKSKKTNQDAAEQNPQSKDSGYFTFINVDPLVQPSYVLPTNNIIQESQISTSTPNSKSILDNKEKDKYSCNMCEETFSREKKLLAHIQSHFNQMDEEDQMRREKSGPKKKTRKS